MHTARLAERIEPELMKYPKARVMQLERALAFETEKKAAAEKELAIYQ